MFTLDYRVEEYGWATAVLGDGERILELPTSYIWHDSLEQMMQAGLRYLPDDMVWEDRWRVDSDTPPRVLFDGESEHYYLVFRSLEWEETGEFCFPPHDEGEVIVTRQYPEILREDPTPVEVFRAQTTPLDLARIFHDAADRVLDRHTPREYEERWWGGEFPFQSFTRLRRCLGLPPKTVVLD